MKLEKTLAFDRKNDSITLSQLSELNDTNHDSKENYESFYRKQWSSIAMKYTFLTPHQIRKRIADMWKKVSQDFQNTKKCTKSKRNRKYYGESEENNVKPITKSYRSKGQILVPLEIDFFPTPKRGVLKRSPKRKESTANDRRVSFNNETEIRYRTPSEDSSTSTLQSKIKITCKSSKELKTGFKFEKNNRSYGHSTSFFGNQSKKAELENKFDMLLNGNCSWSYKSLKVINNHKTDNESNVYSPSFNHVSQVTLQNEINIFNKGKSRGTIDKTGNKRPGNESLKRKFYDLDDISPEVKISIAENNYDFNELDHVKTAKKPRKRAAKKTIQRRYRIEPQPKRIRPPRSKKKVDYAECNSNSEFDENDNEIKSNSYEQVSKTCLEKDSQHIELQLNDQADELEKEQLKYLSGDEISPTSISGTNNTDYESECSDDGFVFQTRFSDKNANVVDITNSIESDSVEASKTIGNEIPEGMTKLEPSDANRISSTDGSPHVIYIHKVEKQNGDLVSENSSLSSPELIIDFEDSNIITRETEKELNNDQVSNSLEDQIDEKCKKMNEEIKEMYDKLERDIFQSDDEFETRGLKKNAELKKADKKCKFEKTEMNGNDKKFTPIEDRYGVETNIKSMIKNKKSGKGNLFVLESEKNSKYHTRSKDDKSLNKKNSSKTEYSNTGTNESHFSNLHPQDHSDSEESLGKIETQESLSNNGTNDEFLSDDNNQLIELNEIDGSVRSNHSSEIFSPQLKVKPFLVKRSGDTRNLNESHTNSGNQDEIQNKSKNSRNNNSQWKRIEDSANDKIGLKLESKFSSKNNLMGKNIKSTKQNRDKSPVIPKSTSILKKAEKFAVFPKVTSKENENLQKNYKLLKAKEDTSKPKTWEDLESKLLMEIDNNSEHEALAVYPENNVWSNPKIISNVEEHKIHSFWEENEGLKSGKCFEISQYKSSRKVVTKKNKLPVKKKAASKQLSQVSNRVSVLESPSISIINKAIAAMNRSTSEFFSRNQAESVSSWSDNSNVDIQGTEYSYSILSATIQTSGNKLNLREKRSKYIQNINEDFGRNNLERKKNELIIEEDKVLKKNIFSMTAKQVITSNCKATSRENLSLESSVKGNKAKILSKNRKKNDRSSISLTNHAHDFSKDENMLTLDNLVDSTSEIEDDNTDSKYYLKQQSTLKKLKSEVNSKQKNVNKRENVSVLKENETFFQDSPNETEVGFSAKNHRYVKGKDSLAFSQSEKTDTDQIKSNLTTKQLSPKDEYIKYLKKLFHREATQEEKIGSGETCNDEHDNSVSKTAVSQTCQNNSDSAKFLMKDDDLFSISSDDFEKDETGYCSEASGLFYDVLDED